MIALDEICDEAILLVAEKSDALAQQRRALAMGDKRSHFTEAEIAKRAGRLPRLRALRNGMTTLSRRRAEVPEWILTAFEGASND